jgi:hypothetical protein
MDGMVVRNPVTADAASVLTKAVLRAAELLEIPGKTLAAVLGVSEASISRARNGTLNLEPGTKAYEFGVLFVRLFRALDSITGGDAAVGRAWLRNANTALGEVPLAAITSITGLVNTVAYLDARRAIL